MTKKYTKPEQTEITLSDGKVYQLAPLDLYVMTQIEEHFGTWKRFTEVISVSGLFELLWRLITRAGELNIAPDQAGMSRAEVGALVHPEDWPEISAQLDRLFLREARAIPKNGQKTARESL